MSRYKEFKEWLYNGDSHKMKISTSRLFKLALTRYKMGEKKFGDKSFLKSKKALEQDIYEEFADILVYYFILKQK